MILTIACSRYSGWLADQYPHIPSPPETIGWRTTVTDNGFVSPSQFGSQDIVCHRGGAPSAIGATASAGATIQFQWNTWPDSHKGPIMNYLAKVNGEFSQISPGSLQFFKISQAGLVSGSNPGTWATDQMIQNGFRTSVTLPSSIAPGKYVLRHEIIALHSAQQQNGAQSYPQCINIEITGGGGTNPGGTPATSFYSASDPGIIFNLYTSFSSYPYPGPAVFS
jgi:hypothetical protein